MNIFQKVSLRDYSTMRLGGTAEYLTTINNKQDLKDAIAWAKSEKIPAIMIGSGSNIIWRDEGYSGLVIVNNLLGFETSDSGDDDLLVTIGAGENWDFVVKRTVDLGYFGIECLSLIPGNAGSTPVQNVGAYGSEISKSLVSLEAYDRKTDEFIVIDNKDCDFSYRSSRFKRADKDRYFITAITLKVCRKKPEEPFYGAIQRYLADKKIDRITPRIMRDAVVAIRESKLPDPKIVPNCGSFFTNPVIDEDEFKKLLKNYPEVSYWETDKNAYKISAAWILEESGFKAMNDPETGMSTWPNQPLVFVNTSAKSTTDLLRFKDKIVNEVKSKFGIELIQEPELLP